MTIRTFKQLGQAYGADPTSITVTIDDVIVYSGSAPNVDEPVPALPNVSESYGVELFSWETDVAFAGTQTISISVTGSPLLITDTQANYIMVQDPTDPAIWTPGGDSVFGMFYQQVIDGLTYSDPFTNEALDGEPLSPTYAEGLTGQWYWIIPDGSTFTATVNIQAGVEPPPAP